MAVEKPERKRIRLPAEAYLVPGTAWLVTIGTTNRAAVVSDQDLATKVAILICERCVAMGTGLDLYCLMPDHAHLLIQITGTSLVDVIRDIKSRSTRLWWRHGGVGTLWQRSFHDEGLRTFKAYEDAATYILNNPVIAGLVTDWSDYSFIGGDLLTHR